MPALPVVDTSPLLEDRTGASAEQAIRALRDACHGPGFCYLRGHGVATGLERDVMAAASAFFALPEPERRAIAIGNSPHFRGYTVLGDERTAGNSDWRDQIDIGPERPALKVGPDDPPWLRLIGPNQWPAALPSLQPAVLTWLYAMDRLAGAVLRALALGLGQPADAFEPAMRPDPYTRVKVMRYPAQARGSDTGQGLGLHHDSGLLSFVLQDNIGGLQVESSGDLIDAAPIAGTYVMNLGEMMQRLSAGYLRATRHRVASPPPGAERIAIAYFVNPRLDAVLDPVVLPAELVADTLATVTNDDPDDPIHASFGENTLKIRMRAHPDVTARFYAG